MKFFKLLMCFFVITAYTDKKNTNFTNPPFTGNEAIKSFLKYEFLDKGNTFNRNTISENIISSDKVSSGFVVGKLIVVDVPYLSEMPAHGPIGPEWPESSDYGWSLTLGSIISNSSGSGSLWEPDGTSYSEGKNYNVVGSSKYKFNLPDGTLINSVYTSWNRRLASGGSFRYREGTTGNTIDIPMSSDPNPDIGIDWIDAASITHRSNFQRIFNESITVEGNDGFTIEVSKLRNFHQAEAIILDVTLPNAGEAPTITNFTPADNASSLNLPTKFKASFNRYITLNKGKVVLKNLSNPSLPDIEITTGNPRMYVREHELFLDFGDTIVPDTDYAIQIDSDLIISDEGLSFTGISDNTTWNFNTTKPLDVQVYFAQTHVQQVTDAYFKLTMDKEALIKINVSSPRLSEIPEVSVEISLDERTMNLPITVGENALLSSFETRLGKVEHKFNDSFIGRIPKEWVKDGLNVKVIVDGDQVQNLKNLNVGAPNKVYLNMFDMHYFKYTSGDYPLGWKEELEEKWPSSGIELQRIPRVIFEELTIRPRGNVPAARASSREEYKALTGVNFDGEQGAALRWVNALKLAGGFSNGRLGLFYINIYGVPSGGQAGGFSGVGYGESIGILNHELGHALSLPHWGNNEAYPYKGDMYGIPAPDIYNKTHIGPIWAFDLKKNLFIPPTVQTTSSRGVAGTYKASPMQGGGIGDQEEGFLMRHFSDYGVNRMRNYMENRISIWNEDLQSYASWDDTTKGYTKTEFNNGVNYPVERDVEVISIMAGVSSTTPQANIIYPPIGPYVGGLIDLFDPRNEENRNRADEVFCPNGGCDISLRVIQNEEEKLYMLPISENTNANPLLGSSFDTRAINLPALDGEVTKIELLQTPDAEKKGINTPAILYTWSTNVTNTASFLKVPQADASLPEISMTATPVSTSASGGVEYLFTETSGNIGATSSDWQTSNTFIATGLKRGETYSYTVTVRDANGISQPSQEYATTVVGVLRSLVVNFGASSGDYHAFTEVTITADDVPDGQIFDKWVVDSGYITISNIKNSTTTFIMPDEAVEISATYQKAIKNNKLKIFILAGQSNMAGWALIKKEDNPDQQNVGTLEHLVATDTNYEYLSNGEGGYAVRDDVWIAYYGNKTNLTPGLKTSNGFGPEIGFGFTIGDMLEDQVLLIKVARGGKSLGHDFLSPSSQSYPIPEVDGDKGFWYQKILNEVEDITTNLSTYFPDYNGNGYEISGFGWHQGWNDRINSSFSASYQTNMANFINDLRLDLNTPNLPFVIATTGMDGTQDYQDIEYAQMAMADSSEYPEFNGNVRVVDTRNPYRSLEFWQNPSVSPQNMGYHWNRNAKTYLNLGIAMARELSYILRFEALSINNNQFENDIKVWNNKNLNLLEIRTSKPTSSLGLFSLDGKLLLSKFNLNTTQNTLTTDSLSQGIYILKVKLITGESAFKKIIIK